VFGGAQSLHVSGMDEALAIPSEEAMKIALRTQQIILEETGVASTIDPLGGSYAVEALTGEIERQAEELLVEIDERGGTVACVESGWLQQAIADSAYDFQLAKEAGDRVVVGVNAYREPPGEVPFELHRVDPDTETRKIDALARFRANRDAAAVEASLDELVAVARDEDANVMPATIAAVRARATGGEIVEAVRTVLGSYVETAVF